MLVADVTGPGTAATGRARSTAWPAVFNDPDRSPASTTTVAAVIAAINRDNVRSTEAGLKYFVLGALSSGMLLYGASLALMVRADLGLPDVPRARTSGLRREEVAALCHMSVDYYTRLERQRGPHPSPQMIAAIAQGLHLVR